ncbi:MAG: flagellar export protein FliJ [Selenomonadaceae bacterium]
MKKFKFQLETLLKVTKMEKEKAEVELAKISKLLTEQQEYMEKLRQEMQQGQKDYERLTEGARITVGTLMTYNSFFAWKREQLQLQDEAILQSKAQKSKRLQELLAVRNKLESIEQLREKRFNEFRQEQLFEEQKQLDEIGLQIYTRRVRRGEEQ